MWVKTIATDKVFVLFCGVCSLKRCTFLLRGRAKSLSLPSRLFRFPLCSGGFDKNSPYKYFRSVYLFRKHVCHDCHTSCPTLFVIFTRQRVFSLIIDKNPIETCRWRNNILTSFYLSVIYHLSINLIQLEAKLAEAEEELDELESRAEDADE